MARPPFRHSVAEFPALRRDLFLVPLALFIVPLMPAADFHARVFPTLEDFKLIVRLRCVFFQDSFLVVHCATPRLPRVIKKPHRLWLLLGMIKSLRRYLT